MTLTEAFLISNICFNGEISKNDPFNCNQMSHCFWHMRLAQLISTFVFITKILPVPLLKKFQASNHFLLSDIVGNPEDRFSHDTAQLSPNNIFWVFMSGFCFRVTKVWLMEDLTLLRPHGLVLQTSCNW